MKWIELLLQWIVTAPTLAHYFLHVSHKQLAHPEANGNMIPFPPGPLDQNVVESQAVNPDYINSSYTRGHLNPSLHHHTHEGRCSTFTLTNVVPQKCGSNDGPWENLEQTVSQTLAAYCLGQAYVVTGVIPYRSDGHWLRNHRVAVPEYMWSAYCCPKYNDSLPNHLKTHFPTYAAVGRNDPNSTEEIVPVNKTVKKTFRGYDVRQMPLETLEMYLEDRFSSVIRVFYERCTTSDWFGKALRENVIQSPWVNSSTYFCKQTDCVYVWPDDKCRFCTSKSIVKSLAAISRSCLETNTKRHNRKLFRYSQCNNIVKRALF